MELKEDSLSATAFNTYETERIIVQETKTNIEEVRVETNVLSSSPMTTDKQTGKSFERKASAWDNLVIKKQISLEIKKPELSVVEILEPDETDSSKITVKNVMEKVLFEYFYSKITTIIKTSIEVTSKVFRKKIGFGFISENNRFFKSKILRIDKSPFFDAKKQRLTNCLKGFHSYSEVFNIWQANPVEVEGKTVFIFSLLTDDQKKSFTVGTIVDVEGTLKVDFMNPVYIDEEFVLIEKSDSAWFLVFSRLGNLPMRTKSVFKEMRTTSLTCSMSLQGLTLFQKLVLGSFSLEL